MLLTVKDVAQEFGVSVESFRQAYLIAEIPAHRISKHAAIRPGSNSANLFIQAVVYDRTTTQSATGGAAAGAHRRKAPAR